MFICLAIVFKNCELTRLLKMDRQEIEVCIKVIGYNEMP